MRAYHWIMKATAKSAATRPDWSDRLDAHVRGKGLLWSNIALAMGKTDGSIRHWRNGHRDINLKDFFELCNAAEAAPDVILFGGPVMTPQSIAALSDAIAKALMDTGKLDPATPAMPNVAPTQSTKTLHQPTGQKRYRQSAKTPA